MKKKSLNEKIFDKIKKEEEKKEKEIKMFNDAIFKFNKFDYIKNYEIDDIRKVSKMNVLERTIYAADSLLEASFIFKDLPVEEMKTLSKALFNEAKEIYKGLIPVIEEIKNN